MTHLIYPTTNFKAIEQVTVERGEGCYVWDNQGNKYLEGLAGLWCTALGYGNQEVIATATEQMNKLTFSHMFGGKTHQVAIDLADKLADMIPMKDAVISFGNSGSDANDTHIKLLRYYHEAIGKPHCRKIIARERSYHGVTVAAASLTGLPVTQNHFDLPVDALGILRTDHPHYYRGKQGEETEDEFVDRIVSNLESMILREGTKGSQVKILDTRKTIPGLRLAQKYAVAIGGCSNHRIGLYDAFLIKENHIAACGGITQAVSQARIIAADKLVEVEVETIAELEQALAAKADVVMLDNFSPADIKALSEIDFGETKIEVSGNITKETVQQYISSAVNYISSGSLTKHIQAVDLSMRFVDG